MTERLRPYQGAPSADHWSKQKGYFTKKDLLARVVNGKKTKVAFFIGDHDHLATDLTTGEWWFAICSVVEGYVGCPPKENPVFRGPYKNRRLAHTAWKTAHPGKR